MTVMTFTDAKQRFSNRVADYVRYRPGYPPGIVAILRENCGLNSGCVIADIGSGTGFLSELFLKNGNRVFGVEPNEAMRLAGEEYLASYDGFTSVAASAEATTLADASVEFVAVGQAFHWFDLAAARREFIRILKPNGWTVIVWNERLIHESPFLQSYEALLRKYGTDYARVNESYPRAEQMCDFFQSAEYLERSVPNIQQLDFAGLAGRLRSSSYVPVEGSKNFGEMMDELQDIFTANQKNGFVRMEYATRIYFGHLHSDSILAPPDSEKITS
ncbi:MAG TPA: class I SAM-dependent methyltransferase [Candidatus Acidoferrum sp.]|jgi:ubiquinone/menaquinone biosynthesis C-methylase UbiE